jgi:membrane-bound lytic murein transglycosylase MltF
MSSSSALFAWLSVTALGAGLSSACAAGDVHTLTELELDSVAPLHRNNTQDVSIDWLPLSVARYEALFVEAGRQHGVDPEMLAIVALVESGGWSNAKSPSGAQGLMQIMPRTGASIADERGLSDHETALLLDPAYNIDLGAYYLARQLQRFGTADDAESVELAAAAYNGGPGRLRRHLDAEANLSDETIRYKHWVRSMWEERHGNASVTFDKWREVGGWRLLKKAEAEL